MRLQPKLYPGESFGTILKKREVAGVILRECRYRPDTTASQHSHSLPYFSMTLEGSYRETRNRAVYDCHPATLRFHPLGEVHTNAFHSPCCRVFSFEVTTAWDAAYRDTPPFQNVAHGSVTWIAARLYRELRATDSASALVVEGLLLELIGASGRGYARPPERRAPGWLIQVRQLLRARFADRLSLRGISATAGVHPVHLARQFRAHYRTSVGNYVRGLRIELACRRVAGTADPLVDIALDAGFADQAHFTRIFRRRIGVPPGEYRKAFQAR